MYSSQEYTNEPVLAAMNNAGSYFGNTGPTAYQPRLVNNCSFPPSFGASSGIVNDNMNNCDIKSLTSVPPPGFNQNGSPYLLPSQRAFQVSFTPNGYVNPPPYGAPSFPSSPGPFPNSTTIQQNTAYFSYQPPNFLYPPPPANFSYPPPPVSFSVPPPPIPRPSTNNSANYSIFSTSNSRSYNKSQAKTKHMPYHCESCDRDFLTEDKHKQHVSEHITCGIEGCVFSAHMKIVEKHISLQHRTGLFNRIIKGNSPEEIAKWITDRKKQYPTKEKIEQKQAQKEEMDKRGESYREQKKKFNNRRLSDRRHNGLNKFGDSRRFPFNKRSHNRNASGIESQDQSSTNTESRPRRKHPVLVVDDEEDDNFIRNLPPFRGTTYYLDDADNDNETDSVEKNYSTKTGDTSGYEIPVFDVSDNDAESNEITNNCLSPTRSEICCIEVINNRSSPTHSDTDSCEFIGNCPSTVQSKNGTSLLESCDLIDEEASASDFNDSSSVKQDCEVAGNDYLNLHEGSAEIGADVSYFDNSQCADNITSSLLPVISTSLDLLKAYCFSDDEEESNEIVEATKKVLEAAPPVITPIQLSDNSEPEECSSKICPPMGNVVSDEKSVSSGTVDCTVEGDLKKTRKRKRHKEETETDKNEATKTENGKQNMPDLLNNHKRYRRPTLLEKLLANEIKHERNVILQCVRYVVKNNYFDIGQKN